MTTSNGNVRYTNNGLYANQLLLGKGNIGLGTSNPDITFNTSQGWGDTTYKSASSIKSIK